MVIRFQGHETLLPLLENINRSKKNFGAYHSFKSKTFIRHSLKKTEKEDLFQALF